MSVREQQRQLLAGFVGTDDSFSPTDEEVDQLMGGGYDSLGALDNLSREGLASLRLRPAIVDWLVRSQQRRNAGVLAYASANLQAQQCGLPTVGMDLGWGPVNAS